jgi:hypothetical protein
MTVLLLMLVLNGFFQRGKYKKTAVLAAVFLSKILFIRLGSFVGVLSD